MGPSSRIGSGPARVAGETSFVGGCECGQREREPSFFRRRLSRRRRRWRARPPKRSPSGRTSCCSAPDPPSPTISKSLSSTWRRRAAPPGASRPRRKSALTVMMRSPPDFWIATTRMPTKKSRAAKFAALRRLLSGRREFQGLLCGRLRSRLEGRGARLHAALGTDVAGAPERQRRLLLAKAAAGY